MSLCHGIGHWNCFPRRRGIPRHFIIKWEVPPPSSKEEQKGKAGKVGRGNTWTNIYPGRAIFVGFKKFAWNRQEFSSLKAFDSSSFCPMCKASKERKFYFSLFLSGVSLRTHCFSKHGMLLPVKMLSLKHPKGEVLPWKPG